jgi:hypothetical protein
MMATCPPKGAAQPGRKRPLYVVDNEVVETVENPGGAAYGIISGFFSGSAFPATHAAMRSRSH